MLEHLSLPHGARLFPTLTVAQMERIRARGRVREVAAGDVLTENESRNQSFFVVMTGELLTVRDADGAPAIVATTGPGQFTGEVNVLANRPALFRTFARVAGSLIQLEQPELRALVQRDAELGELLVRTFLLRRLDLIAAGVGNLVVAGSPHCAETHRVREFLARNSQPHRYIDLERHFDAQDLLVPAQFGPGDIPVVICNGDVLRNPSNAEIAERLGLEEVGTHGEHWDLIVLGAGPAGLAAAVYGASEGLDVLVVDAGTLGGQAGSSSRIENYLGFPSGISGRDLAYRAATQAEKFGTQMIVGRVARLQSERPPYVLELERGTTLSAQAIAIATGVQYRQLDVAGVAAFEGEGVYHAATAVEAALCADADVVVVGGANSAGQAAVFLSSVARRVHMLVRGASLSSSMSQYLIRRIEELPNVEVHLQTELEAMLGEQRLEAIRCRDNSSGRKSDLPVQHVFVMTGGVPNTAWLDDRVALDERGFIKTGPDLSPEDLAARSWPLARQPYMLETSLPGIFAVGDVRGGSMKRVAAAVGEGSTAISYVLRALQE